MRIYEEMEQRSPEWKEVHRGKFTASIASKLLTPTGKVSTQYKGELGRIIAETLGLQEAEPSFDNYWMERGRDLEAEARKWLAVETGMDIHQVGFVESDSNLVGFSPDGYVMEEVGGIEVMIPVELKVPKPGTHLQWLLEGVLPDAHKQQMHFGLAVMGAPYGYFMSYNQDVEPLIVKVERDDYTDKMVDAIKVYEAEFHWAMKKVLGETDE